MTGIIDKVKNTLDPHVDSKTGLPKPGHEHAAHNTTGTTGTTGHHGTTGTTGSGLTGSTGPSGTTGYNNPQSTNQGPHSSNIMNTADPRVDSDRDGRAAPGGLHNTTGVTGTHGTHGSSGLTGTHGSSGLTGTHGSSGLTGSTGHHGTTGTTGSGLTGSTGPSGATGYNNPQSTNQGPHSSNMANTMDPRVDSDRDGRAAGQTALGGGHSTGIGSNTHSGIGSNTHSGIGSNTHSSNISSATPGTGNAPNAGPHNSKILNTLDPRVDSDLDGSKTVGQNKTFT